jgi:hypothetical protein
LIFVIPKAKTTAEKLQMKGERVNIESIKEHVSNFTDEAKTGVNIASRKIRGAVEKGYSFLHSFFFLASKVVGFAFLVGGLIGFVVIVGIFFGDFKLFPFVSEETPNTLYSFLSLTFESNKFLLVFLSLFLVVVIPLISLFVLGLRLILSWKFKLKGLSIGGTVVWVVSIIVLSFYSIETGIQFKEERELNYLIDVDEKGADTLIIDVFEVHLFDNSFASYDNTDFLKISKDSIYLSTYSVRLLRDATIDNFEISYVKRSNGPTGKRAYENAQNINFNYKLDGNKLFIKDNYSFPIKDKIRGQQIQIEVRVPEGKHVIIENYHDNFIFNVQAKSMTRIKSEKNNKMWTAKSTMKDTISISNDTLN